MQLKQGWVEAEAVASEDGAAAGETDDAAAQAADDAAAQKPAFGPDDWRDYLADGDDKVRTRLERFADPKDIWKQNREFERKLSSGELKLAPKENASEEELKAWRTSNGVPEAATDYKLQLPGGTALELDDGDAETYAPMLERAHKMGLRQEQVEEILLAQRDREDLFADRQANAEKAEASAIAEELRLEWGTDFKANQSMIKTNIERQDPELYEALMRGRLSDGSPIGSSKAVLNWIVRNEREVNPTAHLLPGTPNATMNTIADEIKEIQDVMRTDRTKYNKDAKMQERYRQLLDAQVSRKARDGG